MYLADCISTYSYIGILNSLTEVIHVMTLLCGFKEYRGVCEWIILPTPLYDVVMYIVLEI